MFGLGNAMIKNMVRTHSCVVHSDFADGDVPQVRTSRFIEDCVTY